MPLAGPCHQLLLNGQYSIREEVIPNTPDGPDISTPLLTAIMEFSNDAIISKDLHGKITSWNKAAETIYGWKAEEVIGQSITGLVETEFLDGDTREAAAQKLLADGLWQGEVRQKRRDGSSIAAVRAATNFQARFNSPFAGASSLCAGTRGTAWCCAQGHRGGAVAGAARLVPRSRRP